VNAGPRGERGERGKTGPRLPRNVAYAVVFLFVLSLAIGGANLLFSAHEANSVRHQFAVSNAQGKRQGESIEQKLCLTMRKQAARKPPAGNPANNPSRAYLQGEHQTWAALIPELGCNRRRSS
jgi:hypothetical protein